LTLDAGDNTEPTVDPPEQSSDKGEKQTPPPRNDWVCDQPSNAARSDSE